MNPSARRPDHITQNRAIALFFDQAYSDGLGYGDLGDRARRDNNCGIEADLLLPPPGSPPRQDPRPQADDDAGTAHREDATVMKPLHHSQSRWSKLV
ncbi:MAG: hypothetical protein Q8M09_16250 [Pseudomonadota bacterium]|nr:hypothetical protein [Pseudomonadota bacterium]MDP1905772.1 hypothetical protein [Pseudomonadota bacterium]MDP2352010.1 hypothetical protein [Pseudomonadota bacterium]